ncbi:MAG: DUF1330 domain-containing protein [Actinomycetes bacterium]|jgi:hypothetical protein
MPEGQPVRFIAHFSIDDPDRYRIYEKGFFPILAAHGGRFLTYDDDPVILEGQRAAGRSVILEFDSEEALQGWWESPEYRALAEHRHAGTTTHSVIYLRSPARR